MASSSSSSASASVFTTQEYEVFLSFRGDDTRNSFISHLYTCLIQNNIKTFIDDEALQRGDKISRALEEAIQRSKLAIVVFSEDYASSSWCLEELVHILKCRERNDRIVVPVFYHVDPSDVRHQKGSFAAGFDKHEERFQGNIGKVKVWRDALSEAASLSGWDSQVIRPDSELIKKIVEDVSNKLNRIPSTHDDFSGFVGIERRFEKIENLLHVSSSEVCRVLGIWGTGGIGKTTLASTVFQNLFNEFEGCFFIEDVRVSWENGQKKYYDSKNVLFDHNRLRNKRVLVVVDNVNNQEQLEILAEDCFGPGSRIIVTSRDMQMLRGRVDDTYRVEKLDYEESLQLFRSIALRKTNVDNHPAYDLIEPIIYYAKGIPLALKVLASFFCGKRLENWEAELNKFKECPDKKILNILRTSYEGLDEMQKCIFLDVACFFKNSFRDEVERILDGCSLHAKAGLDDLIDKSLISVDFDNKLCIHDLMQQMAWSIVKSSEEVEKRSRLWIPQDACHVLETKKGTRAVEGIFLDMSSISSIVFDSAAFQDMNKLRLLKIFCSDVQKTCKFSVNRENHNLCVLPNSLRYLYWEKFPWKSFPPSFAPQNLVELNMPFSNVEQLWEGSQPLNNLIKIDLNHSTNLIKLPDLSRASKLEHIYLENCTSLPKVSSSIQHLGQLKTLIASGCSSLCEFPKLPENIECLVLSGTTIRHVPQSIQDLVSLKILNLSDCGNLVSSLPSFSQMPSLEAIVLPHESVSRKKNLMINKVFKGHLDDDTSRVYRYQDTYYKKAHMREPFRHKYLLNLPLYRYDSPGRASSVSAVSIYQSNLLNYLEKNQSTNLVFFNCIEFYRDQSILFKVDVGEVMDRIWRIVFPQVALVFSTNGNTGYCCSGDEIPNYFQHQSDGTVDISFSTKPNCQIMGFALCAIVNFSKPNKCRPKDFGRKLELLCEPFYTNRIAFPDLKMDHNLLPINNAENWSNGTRSRDISNASFRFWVGPPNAEDSNYCGAKVIKCSVNVIRGEYGVTGSLESEEDELR